MAAACVKNREEDRRTGYDTGPQRENTGNRVLKKCGAKRPVQRFLALAAVLAILGSGAYVSTDPDGFVQEWSKSRNGTSESMVEADASGIPDYSGEAVIILNDNLPNFNEADAAYFSGEYYSRLDRLGRCGSAAAMLERSMMPTEERGEIGMIQPSGWHTVKYPEQIEGMYLYNRCHLIAYCLTGQNANEKNLITGTRYLNQSLMLPYEEQVAKYLDESQNHVLYRVTPYFKEKERVARGVEMEAYSVEDNGEGICFHVFLYNVQPGIEIDYQTGDSRIAEE